MDRSPGFGSTPSNLIAHLRLAFATAPHLKCLTLLLNVTRWPVLQKVRSHTNNVLLQLVSAGFQVLFHSPPGVLFTFPSRYCSSIGHQVVFRLGGWSLLLPTGFHVSRGTLDHTSSFLVSTTGLLPSMAELSNSLHLRYCIHVVCPQPQRSKLHWFGLFRVRSPLLTESNFFLFLRVLRCFSSPGSPR